MQALFLASASMQAGGGIYQAYSAKAEADAEAELFKEQSAFSLQQAETEREATHREQLRLLRKGRAIKGTQLARAGASGVTSESFLPVMIDTAKELELERFNAAEAGKQRELVFRRRAILQYHQAKTAKARGRAARTFGLLGTAGKAAGSAYQYNKMYG